jgi:HAD superfamily hydrolase (TIGR01549 family)
MSARLQAPLAILLDLDGTLVDGAYAQVAAWQDALARHGLPIPGWRVHRALGRGAVALRDELERAGHALPPAAVVEQVREAHAAALQRFVAHVQPCLGAHELLGAAARLRLPLAVVTGGHRELAERLLRAAFGERDWTLLVAGVDAAAKPEPDALELAAVRLGVAASDCWYVGDSAWDMQAASAAGAAGVGVRSGGWRAAQLREAGAREVFDDLSGVVAALVGCVAPEQDAAAGGRA